MDLIEFFHKKYYPDLSAEQVAAAFGKPEVAEAAYEYVQKKYYPDLPPEKVRRIPIIVNNPNDPRLKAYNDSNDLYNHSNNYRNVLLKNSISPIKNEIVLKNTDVLDKIHKNIPYSKTMNDKIKPEGYYDIGIGNNKQYNESAIYKKPIQPVIYQKPIQTAIPPKPKTNFEKRIQNPTNKIQNADGTVSTHKMMSFESDGKFYAAPTIVEQNGKLVELSPDAAIDYAFKNKEYKEFGTDQEARAYAEGGYKVGTKMEEPKPQYNSIKKMYQGRTFMESTGLRPGMYHPEEVEEKKKSGKKYF
jgi:hypothetical protein